MSKIERYRKERDDLTGELVAHKVRVLDDIEIKANIVKLKTVLGNYDAQGNEELIYMDDIIKISSIYSIKLIHYDDGTMFYINRVSEQDEIIVEEKEQIKKIIQLSEKLV